jgi:hypothetical protein
LRFRPEAELGEADSPPQGVLSFARERGAHGDNLMSPYRLVYLPSSLSGLIWLSFDERQAAVCPRPQGAVYPLSTGQANLDGFSAREDRDVRPVDVEGGRCGKGLLLAEE